MQCLGFTRNTSATSLAHIRFIPRRLLTKNHQICLAGPANKSSTEKGSGDAEEDKRKEAE
jgi:hypothetical protein